MRPELALKVTKAAAKLRVHFGPLEPETVRGMVRIFKSALSPRVANLTPQLFAPPRCTSRTSKLTEKIPRD